MEATNKIAQSLMKVESENEELKLDIQVKDKNLGE
jgi:hypothetical protein